WSGPSTGASRGPGKGRSRRALRRGRSLEPIEGPPLQVCDGEDPSDGLAKLERDPIGKAVHQGSTNWEVPRRDTGPSGKTNGSSRDVRKGFPDLGHEFVAETVASLVIPEGRATQLRAGLRMECDAHAAGGALLGFRCGRHRRRRLRLGPPRARGSGVRAPVPR